LRLGDGVIKMKRNRWYKPGEVVPASGTYRVEHESHGLMHEATLMKENFFPRCRECKDAVRFRLVRPINANHLLPFRSSTILEEFEPPSPALKAAS
jgi:hypothetical protein